MLKDKETKAFLENFIGLADRLYGVAIANEEKSRTSLEIAGIAASLWIKSESVEGISAALKAISRLTKEPALILICGSLYLAGNVLENEAPK